MPWIMTSKRFRGYGGSPPRVEFRIGELPIAKITMVGGRKGGRWEYLLESYMDDFDYTTHASFGLALTELHRRLNAPPPEGFEVFSKKQHDTV